MKSSPLLGRHERSGARLLTLPEGATLLTYGDVPAEYEAARKGCAVFDASDRGRVRVEGADRADFLHALLANRVRGLEPGEGNANLLLTAKGKVLSSFELAVGPGSIDLDTPGPGEELRARLDVYHFTEDVSLEDASEATAPLEVVGPEAVSAATRVLGELPDLAPYAWATCSSDAGEVRVTALPVAGAPGLRLDAGPEGAEPLWEALLGAGALPAGIAVRDILRVEAGRPRWGVDVDDNVYPQEAGLDDAFSLEKGCYVGQEVVAKIDTYGGLNKRLVALRVPHDDPVPRGTPLIGDDGRELGLVTSWAYSFVLDTGLCLAYAKRRHQDVGATFRLGPDGPEAEIVQPPLAP